MSNFLEDLFQYKIMLYLSIVIPILLSITVLLLRKRLVSRPMTLKRIFLPTLFMGTGLLMFIFPFFHITLRLLIEAVCIGLVFSIILIRLSRFEVRDNEIYLLPSKYLFVLLFSFFIIRLLIKFMIGSVISVGETAGMFFVLAFSTLFTWRVFMGIKYVQIKQSTL